MWAALTSAGLCPPLTQQPLLSPASPSPGTEFKGVKCNCRYKSLAQISLSSASAGGHPCSGIPKARENGFWLWDQWILGIKGHLSRGKTALMEPGHSLGRKLKRREGKKTKGGREKRKKSSREGGRERQDGEGECSWQSGYKDHQ